MTTPLQSTNKENKVMKLLVKWNRKELSANDVCYKLTKIYHKEFLKEWNKK